MGMNKGVSKDAKDYTPSSQKPVGRVYLLLCFVAFVLLRCAQQKQLASLTKSQNLKTTNHASLCSATKAKLRFAQQRLCSLRSLHKGINREA
jgi:hypothetical protein